jgi:RimJ/RimL family protein N-acetyltransferase
MALNFRPLAKTDFELFARWLGKPHVNKWWPEPATVAHVAKEYGACTDGDYTTRVYVVQDDLKPIGIIQAFKLESYPKWAELFPMMPGAISIDYFLGEEAYVGRGYGTRMIKEFIDTVARSTYPDATGVATSAEVENVASLGALTKAGFEPGGLITGEYGTPERVMTLRFEKRPL